VAAPAVPSPAGLDASSLVNASDVAWLPAGSVLQPLPGQRRSANYDGLRFGVQGSTDLGLALQWWRFPTEAEATARFEKNLAAAKGALVGSDVGDRSYRAPAYQHRELAFLDAATHSVVVLGCGDQACPGEPGAEHLLQLARLIRGRLAVSGSPR
jgi:hypothetical protein